MPTIVLLGMAIVLYAAAVWFTLGHARRSRRNRRFLASSQLISAEVIDIRQQARSAPVLRSAIGTTDYFPVVSFSPPGGNQVSAVTLSGAHPAPARVGDIVEVRYNPSDPRQVVLAHGLASLPAGSCGSAILLVGLFGMATLVLLVWVVFKLVLKVPA